MPQEEDKKDKPKLDNIKGGCMIPKLMVDKYIRIGQFDICLSDDGTELQIWKADVLIKTFK